MADETTPTTAPAETAPATPAAAGVPEGIDPAVWEIGKAQYATCTVCHGPNGEGVTQLGPPFAQSEWVTGPVENLVRIQLRGLTGPITVNDIEYSGIMGPLSYQSDEQIAAVLTYVRNSFGNKASMVTPEMVTKHRGEVGQPMLTVADLIPPPPKAEAVSETTEPAPAVTEEMPQSKIYNTFPNIIFTVPFLLVIAAASAKFLLSKSK